MNILAMAACCTRMVKAEGTQQSLEISKRNSLPPIGHKSGVELFDLGHGCVSKVQPSNKRISIVDNIKPGHFHPFVSF